MIDISSIYNINEADNIFIDANILIFLFSPSFVSSKRFQVDKYSQIMTQLFQKKCKLFINQLVVSEFINKCMRIDFERNFNINNDKDYKKDYRTSQEYKDTLKIVITELKKFLKHAKQINDDFETFEIKDNFEIDFNDLIIADTVKKNNLKLLSDDGDYHILGIDTNWYIK